MACRLKQQGGHLYWNVALASRQWANVPKVALIRGRREAKAGSRRRWKLFALEVELLVWWAHKCSMFKQWCV